MNWRLGLTQQSPLARRLIWWTILFSSFITLFITASQLYRDYRDDIRSIERYLNQIEHVHLPALSDALWATDQSALQLQLEGIIRLRDMQYAEILENKFVWARAGEPDTENVIRRELPITYVHEDRKQTIGTLVVLATLDHVYQRLIDEAITVLVSNAIKTFLVALFILMAFHHLITRHLQRMRQWLMKLTPDSPPLELDKKDATKNPDELDVLAHSLNDFRQRQAESRALLEAEHQRYKSLFDFANDMVFIVDPKHWRLVDANRRAQEQTGYSHEELVGKPIQQLGIAEENDFVEASMRRLIANGSVVFERTYRRKDGSTFPVEISSRVVYLNEQKVIVSHVRDLTERQQTDLILRESEARFRATFDQAAVGIAHITPDGRWRRVNQKLCSILGYTRDQLFTKTSQQLAHPEDLGTDRELIYKILSGEIATYTAEKRYLRADESMIWVNLTVSLVRTIDGDPDYLIVVLEEISARKRVNDIVMMLARGVADLKLEDFLNDSMRQLASIFNTHYAFVGTYVEPEQQKIQTLAVCAGGAIVENMTYDLAGTPCHDVMNQDPKFISHNAIRLYPDDTLLQEMQVESYFGAPLVTSDGRKIGIVTVLGTRPMSLETWMRPVLNVFATRLANELERTRTQQALTNAQQFSHSVMETVGAIVVVLDREGRVVRFNHACEQLTGFSKEEAIGRNIWDFLIPPEAVEATKEIFRDLIAEKFPSRYENEWLTRHGRRRMLAWSNSVMMDEQGRANYVIATGIDITERRLAETERERLLKELTARNEEMENFVYTISHDLKSPLITIGGFANVLQRDLAKNDFLTADDSLQEIRKAVLELQARIEDLLLLARTGRVHAKKIPLALEDLINTVLKGLVLPIKETHAKIRLQEQLPIILADPQGMERVFTNLIDNALKYRRTGVTPEIEIGTTRDNGAVRLFVRDNGVGIRPRYRERIFELFQRVETNIEGTGVGLAVARRVIEVHGGRLWVESEVDQGSTFWMEFPASVLLKKISRSA